MINPTITRSLTACGITLLAGAMVVWAGEWKSNILWERPVQVKPGEGTAPPSDAIVLFDGKDLSAWTNGEKWKLAEGYAEAAETAIRTKQEFGSCQLHIEFATPKEVEGTGQGRGNSGVYFMQQYEVQVLDSVDNETYFDGQCGAIYKQSPPLVNVCRRPGEWQTYDIVFTAPAFDKDGKVERRAAFTVFQNGVLIQNHFELEGSSAWHKPPSYGRHPEKLPLELQFHGDKVRFRNIWIRELEIKPSPWKTWDPATATQE
jgi:hypothetical protein